MICKSLLGKAHTVMAEGGVAAAMGTVYPEDNWQVHFRDTMRGGNTLNNWRTAQVHAQRPPTGCTSWRPGGAVRPDQRRPNDPARLRWAPLRPTVFAVPQDSPIVVVADVDRPRVRVGVKQGSAYEHPRACRGGPW